MRLFAPSNGKKRMAILMLLDIVSILFAYGFALLLRFDFTYSHILADSEFHTIHYIRSMPVWCAVTLVVFVLFRLYHSIWRQASVAELESIIYAYLFLLPCYMLISRLMKLNLPMAYYIMGYLVNFCLTTGIRFSFRMLRFMTHSVAIHRSKDVDRIMVIGAGAAGQMLIKDLQNTDKMESKVCCVIDDNPSKRGKLMEGVEIVGNRHDIVNMARKYNISRIVYAIPSSSAEQRSEILNICKETKCKLQTIPGMYQLLNNEVSISRLRDVEVSDLLGREQVQVNNEEIFTDLAGKVILVTGGGGSIGSELCRQIAQANPKQLIVFDVYENNAYAIQQELKHNYPDLNLETLIGSVRNTNRIRAVMETYRPHIVFHAAAHKHERRYGGGQPQ